MGYRLGCLDEQPLTFLCFTNVRPFPLTPAKAGVHANIKLVPRLRTPRVLASQRVDARE
jgi:hypothetical protein